MSRTKKHNSNIHNIRNKTRKHHSHHSYHSQTSNTHLLSIRIITTKYDDYDTDLNVYLELFKKNNYKVNVIVLPTDERVYIKYERRRCCMLPPLQRIYYHRKVELWHFSSWHL